jgi:serine/threonine protein phosphatase PrpC
VSEGDRGGVNRDRQKRREREGDNVTLTRAQIANMRAFGLDPDNTKHVEEYTLEVKRSRRAER